MDGRTDGRLKTQCFRRGIINATIDYKTKKRYKNRIPFAPAAAADSPAGFLAFAISDDQRQLL